MGLASNHHPPEWMLKTFKNMDEKLVTSGNKFEKVA
jgi:hypothetical protein